MPQHKKPVPPKLIEPLQAAAELARTAHANRDKLIGQALKGGASVHEVAKVTGLTPSAVFRVGKLQGWPVPEVKAEWEAKREQSRRRKAFDSLDIETQIALLRKMEQLITEDGGGI